jgi:hypothetical protein
MLSLQTTSSGPMNSVKGRTDCLPENSCEGDFDGDGDVDGSDLAIFAADFGRADCPS